MIVLPNARELVSPPSEEPISLALAKQHCLVFHNDDNDLFTGWIAGARYYAEKLSGERMITQQWKFTYPSFPPNTTGGFPPRPEILKIPTGPVQTLDAVTYIDENGEEQSFGTLSGSPLAPEEYSLVRGIDQSYIALKLNQVWPTTGLVANAVSVTVTVGHNDDAEAFAANKQVQLLRSGMLLLIGHFNENREAVIVGDSNPNAVEIPLGIQNLLTVPRAG